MTTRDYGSQISYTASQSLFTWKTKQNTHTQNNLESRQATTHESTSHVLDSEVQRIDQTKIYSYPKNLHQRRSIVFLSNTTVQTVICTNIEVTLDLQVTVTVMDMSIPHLTRYWP